MSEEKRLADSEMVFHLYDHICESCTRYSIGFPWSPRPGLIVATDGWLMVGLYSDCNLPPIGKVPEVCEAFEKPILEHAEWTEISELNLMPVDCLECRGTGRRYEMAYYHEDPDEFSDATTLYKKESCWDCNYRIGEKLFGKNLFNAARKALPLITHFAVREKDIIFKSPYGFACLMGRIEKGQNQ